MLPGLAWNPWAEMILLPQLLEYLELQVNYTMIDYVMSFIIWVTVASHNSTNQLHIRK